jgi:hypothetical protein
MEEATYETIRRLLGVFEQAVRVCRFVNKPSEKQLQELGEAYEAAQAEILRLKAGGYTTGICVFNLPEFGYPELYMRSVLNDFPALPKAPKKPG